MTPGRDRIRDYDSLQGAKGTQNGGFFRSDRISGVPEAACTLRGRRDRRSGRDDGRDQLYVAEALHRDRDAGDRASQRGRSPSGDGGEFGLPGVAEGLRAVRVQRFAVSTGGGKVSIAE